MARPVELEIKVKDAEVKQAEASLNRLKKAADGVGSSTTQLTQQEKLARFMKEGIGNGSKQAAEGLEAVKTASAAASTGLSGTAIAAGVAAAAIAAVVIGFGLLVIGVYKAAQAVTRLAAEFAEYATEIGKASEETGLALNTIAALKFEAEKTKTSFGGITAAAGEFRKRIGEAAAGSVDARKQLNLLGIDGTKSMNNIDAAFKSAIATIVKAPAGIEQARAAYAAFGSEGYKLIPFFQSFNGNVDEAIKKATELGLVVSGKDVDAAKAFNRAYADVQKQIQSISQAFGREFLPIVGGVLRDFNGWIGRNKTTITDWADAAGRLVRGVINIFNDLKKWMDDHPLVVQFATTALRSSAVVVAAQAISSYGASDPSQNSGPVGPKIFDYSRPQDAKFDPAALEAMRQASEKLRVEREAAAKQELAAQIKLFENQISAAERSYDTLFKKISERFKESGNVDEFNANFEAIRQFYGGLINELATGWSGLVERQTLAETQGQSQRFLAYSETQAKINQLGQKTIDLEDEKNRRIAEFQKKAAADYIRNREDEFERAVELSDAQTETRLASIEREFSVSLITETQKIEKINKAELDALKSRKTELQKFLNAVEGNADKEVAIKQQLALLDEQITQQHIRNAERISEGERRKQEALDDLRRKYEDYKQSLEDEIFVLSRGGRSLTRYEEALRAVERGYKDLSEEQKTNLLDLAAQADAVDELNKKHAELKDFFAESLSYAFEGDFKGLLRSFTDRIKDQFIDKLSDVFATAVLGFDPNATDNPVAKPIVKEIGTSNKLLGQIVGLMGGRPVAGGGLGSIGWLIGGAFGSGGGFGGSPAFGGGSGLGQFGDVRRFLNIRGVSGEGAPGTGPGGSGGGLLSQITGPGGIFGSEGFGNNVGTYGAVGSIAGLLGGAIGGRVGGFISGAGSGLALGAQIGSIIVPGVGTAIGAVVGAIAGGLLSLLGGDPKRKRDKREKIPALNKGFAEAFSRLNEILADIRSLRIEPDEAVRRAAEVRAEIAGGFGVEFESKKYRGQSRTMISGKLREADSIIEQIKASAEIARGAADRNKRILPEFAGGNYFADYFKPNGLLPGMFDGRDNILAMISRGEMVLNPSQISRVKALAGGDVFAGAGIPNYPKPSSSSKLAVGGIAGAGLSLTGSPTIMQPNFTLYIEGVLVDERIDAYMTSDSGERTQVKVVKKLRRSGDL